MLFTLLNYFHSVMRESNYNSLYGQAKLYWALSAFLTSSPHL